MEIRLVYAIPRTPIEHRGHVRIHEALVIHWVAVALLVISQFTVIPMLAILAVDSHKPVSHTVSSNSFHAGSNTTTAFKGTPTLNP